MLTNRFRILFILFVVLGVYYPAIFSGVNSVDDSRMFLKMAGIESIESIDWKGLFMPGGGYYYRPLLMLTFYADKLLWDMTESFMHLENVLIHAANSLLVFLIALKVFARFDAKKLELPLLSALLFALHPINTEPVAWISGRSDPLASFFVLLSVLALFKGLEQDRYRYLILSNLLLLLGCMAKEVAVFFLPAACLIALYWQRSADGAAPVAQGALSKVKQISILVLPSLVGGVFYLSLRFFAFGGNGGGFKQVITGNNHDFLDLFRVYFKVLGFYVKKLFFPLPLNFAIVKVNDNYVWLGVAVFVVLILIAFRRNLISAFLITACYLISPAVLVAASRLAWTPIAERYLYLSSAFFAIGIVGALYHLASRWRRESWLAPSAVALFLPMTFCTADRVMIWQDNLTLYQDTQKKSPDFVSIRNELAIALMASGKSAQADLELQEAKKADPGKRHVLLYVNEAKLKLQAGKPEEARAVLMPVAGDKGAANSEVLKMLAKVDEIRLMGAKKPSQVRAIQREIMDTHDHLYLKTGNPMSLYRGGQMALFLGENQKAAAYFEKAYDKAPEGTFYRPAAKKLAEKLRQ